ncbi:hypothetical protein [Halorussus marinus]|uniref:hypothetical protein n=1 Tax=Halorussus marinus TaxID=2505976 RepID=UPI00106EB8F5|nr:hypothetical protein [Halorussus marinus]
MTRENGLLRPKTSFSEDRAERIDAEPDSEGGCLYETPAGPCGDKGTVCEVAGVRVELCDGHLEAVLIQNGEAAPRFAPKAIAGRARA